MNLLTSAEASELLGVGVTAIKRWADEGRLPCLRTAGGHRRFERSVIDAFARGASTGPSPWDEWIALLTGAPDFYRVAARLLEERSARGSWVEVAETLGRLLVELGDRWAVHQLSVAEEHVASAVLQRALAFVSESVPLPPTSPACLLAMADGDDHTLGLSLVDLCLRERLWRSEWLGRATRVEDIVERIGSGRVAMVGLSASASSCDAQQLSGLAEQVGAACEQAGVRLVLGGSGAWPAQPACGARFTDLASFAKSLSSPSSA